MYAKPPAIVPIAVGGGALPTTGFRGLIIAELALALLLLGLILLRLAIVRRHRAPG